ncbi:MAG: acyltransferase [Candidatus Omnitrophota bacterium]|nr:acyltransferase [Candidatus Omnitrophota bacterium]
MNKYTCISKDVKLGKNVKLSQFINIYGCSIGDNTKIGAFVEIQKNAVIGKNCKISSHSFVCEGVAIGDNSFIGHGVMFINDNYPRATKADGALERDEDWADRFVKTKVGKNVSIGSNATILGGVAIADNAVIGAGSVVTKDILRGEIWAGNPAKFIRRI